MDLKIKNAIISVSDKSGLPELAQKLNDMGVHIYSTGGTARALLKAGLPVIKISEYTGFQEILDGRVKSLHPRIHGGILAKRDNDNHMRQLKDNGITPFDMIVINLYPFEKVIKKEGVSIEEAIENIDIGGPSMMRSAAKNYQFVCIVPDPCYYKIVLKELKKRGSISFETRKRLATAVFEKTSYYDSIISSYFHSIIAPDNERKFPGTISLYFHKKQELRYGENPYQSACFYTDPDIKISGVAVAKKLHGKELSFNNILDIESAFEIVKDFDEPACSIIKHTTPCGVAMAPTLRQAFLDAFASDPVSAFGSIIGFNRILDVKTAEEVFKAGFIECIIAPYYERNALDILVKKKNIRLLETGELRKNEVYDYDMKRVIGGVLIQERDLGDFYKNDFRLVTEKEASKGELKSLLFAWKVVKHVKSNAIVLVHGVKTVGIGAGQMSRIDATFMAIHKAGKRKKGSVLASDAFFPKPDAVELAAANGIKTIIQPGGSIQDEDVINLCNKNGIVMYFTGMRHFRH